MMSCLASVAKQTDLVQLHYIPNASFTSNFSLYVRHFYYFLLFFIYCIFILMISSLFSIENNFEQFTLGVVRVANIHFSGLIWYFLFIFVVVVVINIFVTLNMCLSVCVRFFVVLPSLNYDGQWHQRERIKWW